MMIFLPFFDQDIEKKLIFAPVELTNLSLFTNQQITVGL